MPPSDPGGPDPLPPDHVAPADDLVPRFDAAERWAHRSLAVVMGVCVATALALYIPDISARVGHRPEISMVHVVAGALLPVPLLAALVSRAYRRDLGALNRFLPSDWEWLRASDRRSGRIPVGKFNAGQKLNAAFTAGAVAVMLLTGTVMRVGASPDDWKSGATFVHDWLALAVGMVLAGHLWMAGRDPVARLGMRTGSVPAWWARAQHAQWLDEMAAEAEHPRTRGAPPA